MLRRCRICTGVTSGQLSAQAAIPKVDRNSIHIRGMKFA
jgi:hypothetical protein